MPEDHYEAYALRYYSRSGLRSGSYFQYHLYNEADGDLGMDYYFWLVRDRNRTVLIDCGFDEKRGAAKGRHRDTHPAELLSRLDVTPGEVDHIVISHMHYDHVGNLDLFPNATVSIARQELDFWSGPLARKDVLAFTVDAEDVEVVQRLRAADRLRVIDGPEELLPGIRVTPMPGHTPGQLVTEVSTPGRQLVLASDAVHYYEEMGKDRPFAFFHDIEGMYRSYEVLRDLEGRPDTTVIAGHDPRDMAEFVAVAPDCLDLCRPTGIVDRA